MVRLATLLFVLLLPLTACDSADETPELLATINSVEEIVNDRVRPHEGLPHGATHFDWGKAPRMGMGNDPGDFTAMIPWGQLYEDVQGNPATNSRVQIRNLEAYILRKSDGQWHRTHSDAVVEGAAYREDFVNDINKPADARPEPDGGGLSVTAGDGFNYHFWSRVGRVSIDPDDIAGVFITAQARLVLTDPDGPDDRESARYLLGVGGDYWESLTAEWDQWTTNGDIAIGRFKYVTPEWRAFNMITISATETRQNPPPIQ
ncbi:MAG: hypothetical protein AAGJ10_19100 [Bacteroidota bacterium]